MVLYSKISEISICEKQVFEPAHFKSGRKISLIYKD